MAKLFKVGDLVEILPQFQDPGDETFDWYVVEAEEKGRVTLRPTGTGMILGPTYVLKSEWVRLRATND